jgi:hypothetical protein
MHNCSIDDLTRENGRLREAVIQLSTIMLKNVVEQRELSGILTNESDLRRSGTMIPIGIAARLREASLLCTELSRGSCEGDAAQALEDLSVQLAAEAEHLEPQLKIPNADE